MFEALTPQSLDPIMATFARFTADSRPRKVNLAVGMYYDEAGRIPILDVVREAGKRVTAEVQSWGYLLPTGLRPLCDAVKLMVFGDGLAGSEGSRIVTVQTLGGTGALKLGADMIARMAPETTVALSNPTWGNHPTIFEGAGLRVERYPYFDKTTGSVGWPAMRDAVAGMAPGTVLLLHACCHNPTGADLTREQWSELTELLADRKIVPFLDMAYAGFAEGLEPDSYPARLLVRHGGPLFVATSFSKTFGLYGERVGALSIVTRSPEEAALVADQAAVAIRANYSTPPSHGALIVSTVLNDPALREAWIDELDGMRRRILNMRQGLQDRLIGNNLIDFAALTRQRGLFSYTGLSPAQMSLLESDFAIYGVSDGRLCMAALTEDRLDLVAAAIKAASAIEQPALGGGPGT